MKTIPKTANFILFALMAGTLLIALSVSSGLKNDPKFPDPKTGHTIPMFANGVGTVYMTAQEWDAISPYWHAFYVCGGFFLASAVFTILQMSYQGFMEGWRSEGDGK